MVVENKKGEIVAFSSFWFRPAWHAGKTTYPGTLVDVMVDSQYRGGSAFRTILRRIKSEIAEKRMFFGFTNSVSHKIFSRHFKKIIKTDTNIPVFVALVNAGSQLQVSEPIRRMTDLACRSVHKLGSRFRCSKKITVQQIEHIGEEFDQLWNDLKTEHHWIQERGKDYLRWRYQLDPTHRYQIWAAREGKNLSGFLVSTINYEARKTRGLFMDWLVSRNRTDVFEQLVNRALDWMVDQKVDLVETILMDHEKECLRVLRSYFFIQSKRTRSFLASLDPEVADRNCCRGNRLLLALGDTDYIGITNT